MKETLERLFRYVAWFSLLFGAIIFLVMLAGYQIPDWAAQLSVVLLILFSASFVFKKKKWPYK